MQDSGVLEDKAWLTKCAVDLRTGLQQAATATALLEDSLKRADKESAPPPSYAEELDRLRKKYEVGDILQMGTTGGWNWRKLWGRTACGKCIVMCKRHGPP